jgi:hypothetical protein
MVDHLWDAFWVSAMWIGWMFDISEGHTAFIFRDTHYSSGGCCSSLGEGMCWLYRKVGRNSGQWELWKWEDRIACVPGHCWLRVLTAAFSGPPVKAVWLGTCVVGLCVWPEYGMRQWVLLHESKTFVLVTLKRQNTQPPRN